MLVTETSTNGSGSNGSVLASVIKPHDFRPIRFLLIGHRVEGTPGCFTGEAGLTAGRPRGLGSEGELA